MTTALLPELARDLAARLTQELDRRQGQKLGRAAFRDLARSVGVLADVVLSAHAWVRETLEEEGFEGRALAECSRAILEGADAALGAFDRLPGMTSSGAEPSVL